MGWFSKKEKNSSGFKSAEINYSADVIYGYPSITDSVEASAPYSPAINTYWGGDKFEGGFGVTELLTMDYWTLRKRSEQLFTENLYARGLVRRMVTNIVNTGLTPESVPEEEILGLKDDSLSEWTEDVENRFSLWAKSPEQCDYKEQRTFGEIQRQAEIESFILGDVLVTMSYSKVTNLPKVNLISGNLVCSSYKIKVRKGNKLIDGVEVDKNGRHIAFFVQQEDGTHKRLPAYGEKSGRKLAWLKYGTDRRINTVRGEPALGLILQSLKEIDRYRDAATRKAVINSMMAMFVERTEDKPASLPITGGARTKSVSGSIAPDSQPLQVRGWEPGMVAERLQVGEKIQQLGGGGTDVNFAPFEDAIIHAIAWCYEMPAEILKLSFSSNYSASQAAINEFKMFLNKKWSENGDNLCNPIYQGWLINNVLLGKIKADGMIDAWRDPGKQDVFAAWVSAEWYGSVKPSSDVVKQGKAAKLLVDEGFSTRARESRGINSSKYSKNIKRVARENELLAKALKPVLEMQSDLKKVETNEASENMVDAVVSAVVDEIENVSSIS